VSCNITTYTEEAYPI